MPFRGPERTVAERVELLLDVVAGARTALICTHDNPDPDAIASAVALGRLLGERRGIAAVLTHGGVLGRAENRALVRLLRIPLVPIGRVDVAAFDVVCLVDTQPGVGNHALTRESVAGKRLVVVDHHPAREQSAQADFADAGGAYGATSTMMTAYLDAAGVALDATTATALFYGIKSDTRDLGREVGPLDVWAYTHLIHHCDLSLVSAIEHPRLPRQYFAGLVRAFQAAQCFGDVAVCDLGVLYVPDLVAEAADRLVAAEGIRWSIVVGEHQGDIYASLRVADRRFSAGKLVRAVIVEYPTGSAGGHGSMAGARVPHRPGTTTAAARTRARRRFLRRLLEATGADVARGPARFMDAPPGEDPTLADGERAGAAAGSSGGRAGPRAGAHPG